MKSAFFAFGIFIAFMPSYGADDQQTDQWKSITLWNNKALSARLRFLPKASLADENIVVFEFDNQSGSTLDVAQSWMWLEMERKDRVTGKIAWSSTFSGGLHTGKLAPGITTFAEATKGVCIDIVPRCEARMGDGQAFSTPKQGAKFEIEWTYPSATEIEGAKKQARTLLANPNGNNTCRLSALTAIPEVADSLTIDELLSALKRRRDSVDGRDIVALQIAQRFTNDPKVVAYYLEQLSAGDETALSDLGNLELWNPAWVAPILAKFEKDGDAHSLWILGYHRKDWGANKDMVSRLSTALVKYRSLLSTKTSSLDGDGAAEWERNAREAGVTGDKALIPILAPALDDTRVLQRPISAAYAPDSVFRVCDPALLAILMILDGSDGPAFKQAGVDSWSPDNKTRFSNYDHVIALTKDRLKKMELGGAVVRPGG